MQRILYWRIQIAQTFISEAQVKSEIKNHIDNVGGAYSAWYVGISKNARDRLFNDHAVDENTDAWIYRSAANTDVARRIETYFVDVLGTDGGPGGGDDDADQVYAYKKKAHTNP